MHREYRFQSPDSERDFTQHLQELQNRTAFFGDHLPGITRGTPGGYGRIILALIHRPFRRGKLLRSYRAALSGTSIRSHYHRRQHFKCAIHQIRRLWWTISLWIFWASSWIRMFHRIQDLHDTETAACFSHAGQVERTFEVSQSTQQAQCFGLSIPMLNRNSRLYGPVFSTTSHVRRGISPRCWPEYQSRSWAVFFHPRSQQGDFDRVKIHVSLSMFLKPCQVLSERSGQH